MNSDALKKIVNESSIGCIILDAISTQIEFINEGAKNLLEVSGTNPFSIENMFCFEQKGAYVTFDKTILNKDSYYGEVVARKHTNGYMILQMYIRHLSAEDYSLISITFYDITHEKKLQRDLTVKQEELQKTYNEILVQNESLKQLDRAKNKFIALITHELRTPLSAIVATIDVLQNKLYDNVIQHDEFIASLASEAKHLMSLVNDILDYAKIQAAKVDYYVENSSPLELIRNIVRAHTNMAAEYKVSIQVVEPQVQLSCFFDEIRLKQVISNVITNALKFSKPNTVVRVFFELNGDMLSVNVEDQGIGIPEDKFNAVFNEFETVENIKTHHKGTGLGMPISKKLISGMGGDLHFTSAFGKGTIFVISIPIKKVLDEENYRTRPNLDDEVA